MIKLIKLGEIATFSQGQQIPIPIQNTEKFDGCDIFLRIINYTQNTDDYRYIPKQNPKYLVNKEDIVMVRYGAVGFVGRGLSGVLANNLFKVNYKKELVNGDFLYRALWSGQVQKQLLNASQSTSMAALNFTSVAKIQIPLPPLEQQKKIAAILDAADAYRQKTKALIAKYDELTQSLFLDMFGDPVKNEKGWEIKTINDVCSIQGGYSFKSKDFIPETEKTIKVVKITNVHFEDLVWGEVDCLPNYYLEKYSNFSLNEGDILLALTRPIIKSLGTVKAITVKSIDLPCLLNQRVARIVPNEKLINKSFLLRFIFGDNFKNKIEKFSSTSLQPNVSNKQIEGIEIMLPPLLLQNQFSERVQAIEEQKAQAQASLEKSEELFNSLLQKAFKGELV